jgi:hypothetical protein
MQVSCTSKGWISNLPDEGVHSAPRLSSSLLTRHNWYQLATTIVFLLTSSVSASISYIQEECPVFRHKFVNTSDELPNLNDVAAVSS